MEMQDGISSFGAGRGEGKGLRMRGRAEGSCEAEGYLHAWICPCHEDPQSITLVHPCAPRGPLCHAAFLPQQQQPRARFLICTHEYPQRLPQPSPGSSSVCFKVSDGPMASTAQ